MNVRRASALLVAVVATGVGLTACSNSASPSATPGTTAGSPAVTAGATATATAGTPQSTTTADSTAAAQPATSSSAMPAPSKAPDSVAAGQGASGSFTVPSIAGENVADGSGTYTKGTDDVEVHVCVTQTGSAFAVGIEAFVYNAAGASKDIGAVVLTGSGHTSCGTLTFIGYTSHLKVHTFIGAGGNITKTSPVVSVY